MASKLFNMACETTTTTGTGTVTLTGTAVPSFLTFAQAGVATGDTITYSIEDVLNREVGRGVYTTASRQLTRAAVLRSTNSNNAINLSGNGRVSIVMAAEDLTEIREAALQLAFIFPGKLNATTTKVYLPIAVPMTLPQNLTGSRGYTAVNAASTFTIARYTTSWANIGSIACSASGAFTFTFANAVELAAGNVLSITVDTAAATSSDASITLLARRT
jgi:hypothetical protein